MGIFRRKYQLSMPNADKEVEQKIMRSYVINVFFTIATSKTF